MKKFFIMFGLLATLISIAIYETIAVNNFIKSFEFNANEISVSITENKEDLTKSVALIKEKKENWQKTEKNLCLMFSYRDLTIINDCYARLLAYAENNDYDNAYGESQLLISYGTYAEEIMQFNFQNLF